ncbi:MAG: hypothetical protein H6797_02100 [Candidatus Nomurabacteria bacterium]|nr:MAG: hypothetical protein H6797_02100 [Candidatus Nomurabacteria bacterium]
MNDDDIQLSCCDPFVQWHGYPAEFVQAILPKPATFLFEYEEQLTKLNEQIQEAKVCEHYANQTRIYLRTRCDDMLDCLAQFAEYLGWQPSYVEQIANEGSWENLLSKSTDPSS